MTSEEISQLGGRFSPLPGQSDPFNKTSEINIRGFESRSFLLIWLLNKENGMILPTPVPVSSQRHIPLSRGTSARFVSIFQGIQPQSLLDYLYYLMQKHGLAV
jgi:hypothetical protein